MRTQIMRWAQRALALFGLVFLAIATLSILASYVPPAVLAEELPLSNLQATSCEARPSAACHLRCETHQVCRSWQVPPTEKCVRWDADCDEFGCWEAGSFCWTEGGYWESECHDETTCTEECVWEKCNGNNSGCTDLWCYGTCGAGANCECRNQDQNPNPGGCNTAADCGGTTTCPNSQTGGSYWTCQANVCIAVCGSANEPPPENPPPGNPTPTRTPTPLPTRTPIPTPTPFPRPSCATNPEDYGGSVTRVTVLPPDVQVAYQPQNPVVVGQDTTKRGVDLNTTITLQACSLDWHYRVLEDYIWCGKATCNCTVDNCELRQRWVEWDETCSENFTLANVTIDGRLNAESVAYINGPLQQKYPGVKVYQGSIAFFPNVLARVVNYVVGNPTVWQMQGLKYPLADPGSWDVTVNIATQPTTHCSAQQWSIPFPKKIPVYLREQTLTK